MKKRNLLLPLATLALLLSFGLTACGNGGGGGGGGDTPAGQSSNAQQEKITIEAAGGKKTLTLGESVQLTASVDGVSWESANEAVATVSQSGLVESKGEGTVKITAKKEGYKDGSIQIKVDLEKITVTAADNKTTLIIGEEVQLTANKDGVTWSSSDAAVASVTNGLVKALKAGSATIKAEKQGFAAGSITITVTRPPATATLHMEDAEHYAADGEWSSSNDPTESPVYNKSNATDGTCCAHFGGGDIETIRFTSSKAVKAEIVLMVGYYYAVENFTAVYEVKFNNNPVTFPDGQSYTPEDTSNYTYQPVSFGELDLIADTNVLEIKMKEDASRIPYMDDLLIYAAETVTITLVPAPAKLQFEVTPTEITIAEGKTAQITSSVADVSYKSASTSVASVSETGLVTGLKAGSTTITVSKQGYSSVKIPVTVTEAEGTIVVQVEDGTSEGDVVTFKTSNNLDTLMVDQWPTDAVLTLSFDVTTAGTYSLYMNARAHGGYNGGNTDDLSLCMEVAVNGGTPLTMEGSVTSGAFKLYLLGEVSLSAGPNTMTVKSLTDIPTIDLFKFIPKA